MLPRSWRKGQVLARKQSVAFSTLCPYSKENCTAKIPSISLWETRLGRSRILKLNTTYFCPTPQSTFSHIHDIMRSLADKAGLRGELEERRAKYLQSKVEALLERALPGAALRHAVLWRADATNFETDHLALIDRTAVIVEDKSGALSELRFTRCASSRGKTRQRLDTGPFRAVSPAGSHYYARVSGGR